VFCPLVKKNLEQKMDLKKLFFIIFKENIEEKGPSKQNINDKG
jgi:hypothetical protein